MIPCLCHTMGDAACSLTRVVKAFVPIRTQLLADSSRSTPATFFLCLLQRSQHFFPRQGISVTGIVLSAGLDTCFHAGYLDRHDPVLSRALDSLTSRGLILL